MFVNFCKKLLRSQNNHFKTLSSTMSTATTASPRRSRSYQVVVAATREMGIGKDGNLPWKLPSDLKFFKELTLATSDASKRNAVIMGRKTWDSIPSKYRPLNGRLNVVISRSYEYDGGNDDDVVVCGSFSSALDFVSSSGFVEKVFVIGGGQILRDTMNGPGCEAIHVTEIDTSIECDTFVPSVDTSVFRPWYSSLPLVENGIRFSFVSYVRVNCGSESVEDFGFLPKMVSDKHEEFAYLRLVEEAISSSQREEALTESTAVSKFDCEMRYNLRKYFPLLTTQDVSWQHVVEEFLSFLNNSGSSKKDDVYIKKDLRPVQGFQWRNFGVRYANADFVGREIDHLPGIIDRIKSKPDDVGYVLWTSSDLKSTAFPSCHVFAQFYAANGELSCQVYQKTGDIALEVPLSIASYALLTCTVAHVCGIVPGDLIHVIGNAYVSKTQIRQLQEQTVRHPKPFPILRIDSSKDIDLLLASEFELIA